MSNYEQAAEAPPNLTQRVSRCEGNIDELREQLESVLNRLRHLEMGVGIELVEPARR